MGMAKVHLFIGVCHSGARGEPVEGVHAGQAALGGDHQRAFALIEHRRDPQALGNDERMADHLADVQRQRSGLERAGRIGIVLARQNLPADIQSLVLAAEVMVLADDLVGRVAPALGVVEYSSSTVCQLPALISCLQPRSSRR